MNDALSREALQLLFAGELLFAVPEPAPVEWSEGRGAAGGGGPKGRQGVEKSPSPPAIEPEPQLTSVAVAPTPVEPLAPGPQPSTPLPVRRETILLVDRPTLEDLALLDNILKAVSLSLADVDLLDLQKLKGQDFRPLLESKVAHQFISFGVGLKKLNLDLVLVPYRIQPVEGIQFLLADPLAVLHTDKAKKKALWINLQVLFGLA